MICYCGFRCGPCRMMTPVFARLSVKYSAAVFLKVDVDQCQVRLLHSRVLRIIYSFLLWSVQNREHQKYLWNVIVLQWESQSGKKKNKPQAAMVITVPIFVVLWLARRYVDRDLCCY